MSGRHLRSEWPDLGYSASARARIRIRTEGSGGIWERLQYDWSDPNHVVLTTTDSNTWGGASGAFWKRAFENSVKAIEARNGTARETGSS